MSDQALVIQEPVSYQPSALLAMAIQKDLDIDKLTKLMDLQERYDRNEAKKAYVVAMANFKKDPPKIFKDMHVEYPTTKGKTSYNHASLGNVVAAITESLSKQDMTVNWSTNQKDGKVSVTCTVTHIQGYSESTTIEAPPDNSGGKNSIQSIGSTITYLQRYTLLAICGLATNEFETDGQMPQNGNGKNGKKTETVKTLTPKEQFLLKCADAQKWLFRQTGTDNIYLTAIGNIGVTQASEIETEKHEFFLKVLKDEMTEVKAAKDKLKESEEK